VDVVDQAHRIGTEEREVVADEVGDRAAEDLRHRCEDLHVVGAALASLDPTPGARRDPCELGGSTDG
jgi:hypothetical protein